VNEFGVTKPQQSPNKNPYAPQQNNNNPYVPQQNTKQNEELDINAMLGIKK
jgi:hypothetical protein